MDLVQVCKILYVSFESVDLLSTQVIFFTKHNNRSYDYCNGSQKFQVL